MKGLISMSLPGFSSMEIIIDQEHSITRIHISLNSNNIIKITTTHHQEYHTQTAVNHYIKVNTTLDIIIEVKLIIILTITVLIRVIIVNLNINIITLFKESDNM